MLGEFVERVSDNSEIEELLESLNEGEESSVRDLSTDVFYSRFSLSEEQSNRPGVLCTVEGVGMGPFDDENRNERNYTADVPIKGILQSSYVKEMMKYRTLLGEPHHPKDRSEIWLNHVSHCIVDMWMSEDNRFLMVKYDILDTPNGRILKTLIDYGCILGTSARARGKTKKIKGMLYVVPEAYSFKTFDMVTNPGFVAARVYAKGTNVNEEIGVKEGLEKLTESTDIDTLKSVRSFIEYCDDESIKALLPLVESRLEVSDNSEANADYPEDLIEELSSEVDNLREKEIEYKNQISILSSQITCLQESIKKSGSDREEVLTEDIINLKRSLLTKEENLQEVQKSNLEILGQLDECLALNEDLAGQVKQLTESRQVAVKSLREYRAINESLKQDIEELQGLNEENESSQEVPVMRRRKIGIGSAVSRAQSVSLCEENERDNINNERLSSLIRKVGGK